MSSVMLPTPHAPRLLPRGGRVGFEPVQQAREFVVHHHGPDVDPGDFRAAHRGKAGYQKLNLFLCRHLRPVHAHS